MPPFDNQLPPAGFPQRRHLRRLDRVGPWSPIFFVTVCTLGRRPLLTGPPLTATTAEALATAASRNGWLVGRYVLMPDHVHFFCAPGQTERPLQDFVGGFKQLSTRAAWATGLSGRLWQAEFFDHLLRSAESYEQKWEYVRANPVRHGLCATADDWPYQGEFVAL